MGKLGNGLIDNLRCGLARVGRDARLQQGNHKGCPYGGRPNVGTGLVPAPKALGTEMGSICQMPTEPNLCGTSTYTGSFQVATLGSPSSPTLASPVALP